MLQQSPSQYPPSFFLYACAFSKLQVLSNSSYLYDFLQKYELNKKLKENYLHNLSEVSKTANLSNLGATRVMKKPLVNLFTGFKRRKKERIQHKQCNKSSNNKGNKSLT